MANKSSLALIYIAFGTFAAILGAGILCGGGFNSVMMNPTDGPYSSATAVSTIPTTVGTTTTAATTTTTTTTTTGTTTTATASNTNIVLNNGHFISLVKFYPELFNWSKIRNLRAASGDIGSVTSGIYQPQIINREASDAYTRRHAGENSWIFALYFPIVLVVVALGFVAFFRKSGYTLALVGVGLSAVMISFTLIVVVHYQAKSFVPQVNDAFTDCSGLSAVFLQNLRANVQFGSLNGPAPRRAWLCKQDWSYDNDFKTAANLVYGGASTAFVGFISLLIGFAYLVHPFVTPVPTFAKNNAPSASVYRGSSLDFDDYSEYSDY